MKIVIFGLTISSSWGNGHATLWRGLCHALARRGHDVIFFERDTPYYAEHRDLHTLKGGKLYLYNDWAAILPIARREINSADATIITSYCADTAAAFPHVCESSGLRVYYDLDTPVTLAQLKAGALVPYIPPEGLADFDLVLSFTGGRALVDLRDYLGAPWVEPLYGSVDPAIHRPVAALDAFRADLSYLGTYAEDRQAALEALFVEPARQRPQNRFLIGGAQFPSRFPWTDNIFFARHVEPGLHPAFFSSSRLTLNVTRAAMRAMGHCPSGRLFEAAACGTPLISDYWQGLEDFFEPGREIFLAHDAGQVIDALELSDAELQRVGDAARERVLTTHTATVRARELEEYITQGLTRGSQALAPSESVKAGVY